MSLIRSVCLVLVSSLSLFACGGDDDDHPDGGDALLCPEMAQPAATIDSYPGTYSGATVGGGADLHTAQGVCGETEDQWFDQVGEDVVVELVNLTPGQLYGVTVASEEDLGLYVVTGCQTTNAGPTTGECLVFNDASFTGESSAFTAPASGSAWVVVYSAELDGPPPTGAFEITVVEAECQAEDACSAPTPACVNFECVECADAFDCASADAPVCGEDNACAAGHAECTGDDAADDGDGGDDGPAAATSIATPTDGNPTVVNAAACSVPSNEEDWFKVTIDTEGRYGFQLDPDGDADLDLILMDSEGGLVNLGFNEGFVSEGFASDLTPGDYYLVTYLYDPMDEAVAAGYTVTVRVAECETSFDCDSAAAPVCNGAAACEAGPAECTGDDGGDDGGGDDGPAGATDLTGPVNNDQVANGSICNVPDATTEVDYYAVTVTAGQGIVWDLSWVGTADLDLQVYGPTGLFFGASYWVEPEQVTLTYLPAGTYYAKVTLFAEDPVAAAVDYTISATRTATQVCGGADDCAAEYSNQIYRGSCTGGACDFIPAGDGDAGTPCDSADDCGTAGCSYIPYEADAQLSVCTELCDVTTDCDAVGEGLTCTAGLDSNFCVPTCTQDLDCGASSGSSTLDDGQPWDYFTCTEATGVCEF